MNISTHEPSTPVQGADDKRLVWTALSYALTAWVAAAAALSDGLAAEFLGHEPSGPVVLDFVLPWGWGTGLSPSLSMIMIEVALAWLLARAVRPLQLWRGTLTVAGFLFMIGQLGEPHTYFFLRGESISSFRTLVIIAMVVLPLLMAVTGIRAMRAARRP
jgi:hypothetical protein